MDDTSRLSANSTSVNNNNLTNEGTNQAPIIINLMGDLFEKVNSNIKPILWQQLVNQGFTQPQFIAVIAHKKMNVLIGLLQPLPLEAHHTQLDDLMQHFSSAQLITVACSRDSNKIPSLISLAQGISLSQLKNANKDALALIIRLATHSTINTIKLIS